jgi:O-antigen ligase
MRDGGTVTARVGLKVNDANMVGTAAWLTLTAIAFANGGYFEGTQRLSALALVSLAGLALLVRGRTRFGVHERVALAALVLLLAWTALSAFWSSSTAEPLHEAERVLVYVAGLAALLIATNRSSLPALLAGALTAIVVVSAYGLGSYFLTGSPANSGQASLVYQPLGYANAVGILSAMGIVLALGTLGRARWYAAGALAVLVPTLALSSSRGAWIALAAGLAAAAALAWRRRGRLIVGGAALVAGTGLAVALLGPAGHGAGSWLGSRPGYWRAALNEYRAHPVLGDGAGAFGRYWLQHPSANPEVLGTRDAHSLYLETLAELGPVGLALLLIVLGAPLAALPRARSPAVPAAAGAYIAYLVHAGVDWDWEMPAVTLAALLCGAALFAASRREDL